jgi:hypothetical protein
MNSNASAIYSKKAWIVVKTLFAGFWLSRVVVVYTSFYSAPLPRGLFHLIPNFHIHNYYFNYTLFALALIGVFFYISERFMPLTTLACALLSIFTFSLEESNGILNVYSLLSAIWLAQFVAYLVCIKSAQLNIINVRFSFTIQVIASAYTLSAISKLATSGVSWVFSGPRMTLSILKSFTYEYITTGKYNALVIGNKMAKLVEENNTVVCTLLATTLLLEFFAWVACINKRVAFWYGLSLLIMHLFIYLIMNINLVAIWYPMFLFMILPGVFPRQEKVVTRESNQ